MKRKNLIIGTILALLTVAVVSIPANDIEDFLKKHRVDLSVSSGHSHLNISSSYHGTRYSISHMSCCPGGQWVYRSQRCWVPGRTIHIREYRREFDAYCDVTISAPGCYKYYGYYDWVECGCIHYERFYHRRHNDNPSGYIPPPGVPYYNRPDSGYRGRSGYHAEPRYSSRQPTVQLQTINRPSKPPMPKVAPNKGHELKSKSEVLKLQSVKPTRK